MSLVIFDIDHFKLINDTYGHNVGDAVLVELAKVVSGCTRSSDLLTRWGGEEFTILMPCTTLRSSADVAEKIRQTIEMHRFAKGYRVTVSLGIAEWALTEESFDTLLSRADEALYQAKNDGRNCSVLSFHKPVQPSPNNMRQVKKLIWRTQYESGDAEIDLQHRQLFERAQHVTEQVSEFYARLPTQGNDNDVFVLIDRMLSEVDEHFALEERKLLHLGWPGFAEHRIEHQQLVTQALELRQRLLENPTVVAAAELTNFLMVEVVANHILRSDRKFFSLLKNS